MLGSRTDPFLLGHCSVPLYAVDLLTPLKVLWVLLTSLHVVDAFLPLHAVISDQQNLCVCLSVCECLCMPANKASRASLQVMSCTNRTVGI